MLDHAPKLQAIVLKLPANLQTKWRETVVRTRRKDNAVAGFNDFRRLSLTKTTLRSSSVTEDNKKFPPHDLDDYTRQGIPAYHKQITTSDIVSRIEHLKEIAGEIPACDPELEIGLLIGGNRPKALVPLMVVPNDGDGPSLYSAMVGQSAVQFM